MDSKKTVVNTCVVQCN